jgi:hypothetical protein
MSREVEIIVRAPVGRGKSALVGEIEILLLALGVEYCHEDMAAWEAEKNLSGADWTAVLEQHKPQVVLKEEVLLNPDGITLLKIYEDGKAAARAGQAVTTNPYLAQLSSSTAVKAVQWLTGYNFELALEVSRLREKAS